MKRKESKQVDIGEEMNKGEEEQEQSLCESVVCRNDELLLLQAFINLDIDVLSPSLIVHGVGSTGKTYTVTKFLDQLGVNRSIIRCDQCISHRVLLTRCIKSIIKDSGVDLQDESESKVNADEIFCESFEKFMIHLMSFAVEAEYQEPHVLVLDRIDLCIENPSTLYSAFARLHEVAPLKNFCIVFIISTLDPKPLITATVPHIYFRTYTQDETIRVLQHDQICEFPDSYFSEEETRYQSEKDGENEFWKNYVKVVVDSLFYYTGADLLFLKHILLKLWDDFIKPITEDKYRPNQFLKIYKDSQFLLTGEYAISDSLIPSGNPGSNTSYKEKENHELPLYSKYILIASYLASFNPAKHDIKLYTRQRDTKKRGSNRKKKSKISSRLLSPSPFELERMLAILSVIYQNEAQNDEFYMEVNSCNSTIASTADLFSQIATLNSMRLINKTTSSDPLNAKTRWKCNMSWPMIKRIAEEIHFPIQNYITD